MLVWAGVGGDWKMLLGAGHTLALRRLPDGLSSQLSAGEILKIIISTTIIHNITCNQPGMGNFPTALIRKGRLSSGSWFTGTTSVSQMVSLITTTHSS
jgi:hypothetical protein